MLTDDILGSIEYTRGADSRRVARSAARASPGAYAAASRSSADDAGN